MAPAVPPAELRFAQRLASHEKRVRERAARRLRQFLSAKTQTGTGGFTQEELLKIWKGLFYCLWVQDEPLLQEELTVTMSQLVHVVNNSEAQHLFIRTFWQTMNREWEGVDRLRLDKYHMLIRLTLRQSFEVLKRNGWEESRIRPLLDILVTEVLHPESQSPNGVRRHFIAVYLEELSKVGGKELLADQNLQFIDPFCKIAAKTKDRSLVQTITGAVFEAIARRPPLEPEASAKDQSARGGGGPLSGEEPLAHEVPPAAKAVAGKGPRQTRGAAEDRGGGGDLEATGSLLQFDYKAVAARLLEVTLGKNTPPFNRDRLSRLARKFQDLSEGGVTPPSMAEDGPANGDSLAPPGRQMDRGEKQAGPSGGDAAGSTTPAAEGDPSRGPQRRKRKRRRRGLQPEQPDAGSEVPAAPETEPPRQSGAQAPATGPGGAQKRHLGESPPIPVKRKRLRKKGLLAVGEHSGPPEDEAPAQGAQGPSRKRKLGAPPANGTSPSAVPGPCPAESPTGDSKAHGPPPQGDSHTQRPRPQGDSHTQRPRPQGDGDTQRPLTQGGKMKRRKKEAGALGPHGLTRHKLPSLAKRKRVAATLGSWPLVALPRQQGPIVLPLGAGGALGPPGKKQPSTEKDLVRFTTPLLPKPVFCRRARSSTARSAPRPPVCLPGRPRSPKLSKTPPGTKKVTFGLSKNMTAEFKKTDKSILVSPTGPSRVAFDPKQQPLHGVLKSPACSPLTTKKLLVSTPQRRPTAMDFF